MGYYAYIGHLQDALFVGLPLKSATRLQLISNVTTRLLTGACLFVHLIIAPLASSLFPSAGFSLKGLKVWDLDTRRMTLTQYTPVLRGTPDVGPICMLEGTRKRIFSVVAPGAWDILPKEVLQALAQAPGTNF